MTPFAWLPLPIALATGPAAGVAGCTVGPDYIPPEPETPDSWHMQLTKGLAQGQADFQTWWTLLDDPALNRLIGRSLEANLELRQAVARVYEGRARLGIAKGRRVPEVNSQGSYQRQRFSDNILGDPGSGAETFSLGENNFFSLGLDASWELDLWGRVRRSVESAGYGYQASIEDYRDVLVTLLADVAFTYVENRTAQTRLEFARKNAELQAGAVRLTRDRRSAGLVGDLDVRQAELNLARTESAIPRFEEAGRGLHPPPERADRGSFPRPSTRDLSAPTPDSEPAGPGHRGPARRAHPPAARHPPG